jgi:hypothetical protein
MFEQASFQPDPIDARAEEIMAEVRQMVKEAIEFSNRSCGQYVRYTRERNTALLKAFSIFTVEQEP